MASILTKQADCVRWHKILYVLLFVQASGNVSQLEAQVAGLQQSLLQAKDVLHLKLQDALGARRQAEKHMRVRCGALALVHLHSPSVGTMIATVHVP